MNNTITLQPTQAEFWDTLKKYCGKAYLGELVSILVDDKVFTGNTLVMHVKSCEENRIRVPFFVGQDRSRTWVFTKEANGILLKHDHRHEDGTPDKVTMYGGMTSNSGSNTMQVFPADQETVDLLPRAISNVWWVELVDEVSFSYNLRRVDTDRVVSIRFDLTKEAPAPDSPWGWTE